MNKQPQPALGKIGDACPFCGKPALLLAPSGANLIYHECNRIVLLRQHWTVAEGPIATRDQKRRGRPMKLSL
jgi:hypothetical protein